MTYASLAFYRKTRGLDVPREMRAEKTLGKIDKIIVDKNAGSGIVPYLPLPELKKKERMKTNQDISNE